MPILRGHGVRLRIRACPTRRATASAMDVLETIDLDAWTGPFGDNMRGAAVAALESGKVLYFPHLAFALRDAEKTLLTPDLFSGRAKNISLDPDGRLKHAARDEPDLQAMMQRFAVGAVGL